MATGSREENASNQKQTISSDRLTGFLGSVVDFDPQDRKTRHRDAGPPQHAARAHAVAPSRGLHTQAHSLLADAFGLELGENAQKVFWDCVNGERPLDIFVFEGSVIDGPDGSGRYGFSDGPAEFLAADRAADVAGAGRRVF